MKFVALRVVQLLAACVAVSALPQSNIKRDILENCTDIQYRVPW